jgi:hypothetical protein
VRPALIQHDELFGRADRQLPEQELVDEREDRGIGADAERQRQDRDRGEQRTPAEPSKGEAEVTERRLAAFDGPGDPRVYASGFFISGHAIFAR